MNDFWALIAALVPVPEESEDTLDPSAGYSDGTGYGRGCLDGVARGDADPDGEICGAGGPHAQGHKLGWGFGDGGSSCGFREGHGIGHGAGKDHCDESGTGGVIET